MKKAEKNNDRNVVMKKKMKTVNDRNSDKSSFKKFINKLEKKNFAVNWQRNSFFSLCTKNFGLNVRNGSKQTSLPKLYSFIKISDIHIVLPTQYVFIALCQKLHQLKSLLQISYAWPIAT